MQRLWSPWRSEYVGADEPDERGCFFCNFAREQDDERNLVLLRGEFAFVVLNRYPYNSGHVMIAPYEHTSDFAGLSTDTTAETTSLLSRCLIALDRAYKPDGYNTGMNLGSAAGAGVADHLHQHVVPRWAGDVNFMPSLGDVKVMPELLRDTYQKLVEALAATST
ncbi:MAG: HIT domain-containing protein [Chloroflexia bacterium]